MSKKFKVEYNQGFFYIGNATITPEQLKKPERALARIFYLLKDGVSPDVVCDFISALDENGVYKVDWTGAVRI